MTSRTAASLNSAEYLPRLLDTIPSDLFTPIYLGPTVRKKSGTPNRWCTHRLTPPGYVVDGTLLPCWSWAGQRQLFSGKHRTTGLNVQLVCDLNGRLVWISDPVDGCRHDSAALASSGVLQTLDPATWMGGQGVCRDWRHHADP